MLQERGLTRGNTVVHPISYNADFNPERQPSRQVQQVIDGRLDVAAIWGPMAGWYKTVNGAPLTIQPINLMDDSTPLEFELSIGMRKSDEKLQARIEQALMQEKTRIRRILEEYGVPLVECDRCIVSGDLPSHGPYKAPVRVAAARQVQAEPTSEAQLTHEIDAALTACGTAATVTQPVAAPAGAGSTPVAPVTTAPAVPADLQGRPVDRANASKPGTLKNPYTKATEEIIAQGRERYLAYGCNGCHGGGGGGGMGPPLSNEVWVYGSDGDVCADSGSSIPPIPSMSWSARYRFSDRQIILYSGSAPRL